ncbi:MAG: hypothetical protein AAGG51_15580 [Cyanobacteria bacterium P01_G01_bin.54]
MANDDVNQLCVLELYSSEWIRLQLTPDLNFIVLGYGLSTVVWLLAKHNLLPDLQPRRKPGAI